MPCSDSDSEVPLLGDFHVNRFDSNSSSSRRRGTAQRRQLVTNANSTIKMESGDKTEDGIVPMAMTHANNNRTASAWQFLISPLLLIYRIFIPSRIFLKFFIAALIPALADQIIPLFFTGQIPDESALSISSQFIFISIIIEVIQEGIVNSIFFYIGQNYKEHRVLALQGLKICIVLAFVLGSLLTVCILVFAGQFVAFIDTPKNITDATEFFLWTSSFSFPLTLTSAVISNYLYVTTHWLLIVAQLSQVVTSLLINMALFGYSDAAALPSFRWGVRELGYYKIIAAAVNLTINIVFLHIIERMTPVHFVRRIPFVHDIKSNFKTLFKVSWGNFGDSAVRNFFYFMVTLKFINFLGETESGAWGLLNGIVWSLLLIPSYTTANYVKVQVGHDVQSQNLRSRIKKVAKVSFISLTAWLALLALLSGLLWPSLAAWFSQSNAKIQEMSGTMFYQVGWIFIIFSYNNAMDSLFFGTGRTEYIFYQSVGTNMLVYFVPWILYLSNVLEPTLWWVLGLYIAGMLVDFCLTSMFCLQLWRQIPQSTETCTRTRTSYHGESQDKLEEIEDEEQSPVPVQI